MRYFEVAVVWFVVLAPVVGTAVVAASVWRSRGREFRARLTMATWDLIVGLTVLGVAAVTLIPQGGAQTGLAWGVQVVPFSSILDVVTFSVSAGVALRIVGLNILLFVPIGLVLALRTRRWLLSVGVAASFSLVIEVLQALLPLGRTSNVDDVILNTAGAAIGATIGLAAVRIWDSTRGSTDDNGAAAKNSVYEGSTRTTAASRNRIRSGILAVDRF